MGVRGLWDVVGPVAKPIQLESLRKQRLAVDASIWIYQFLKAVRDSEGNVVKYAHIIGFFRRICKLLYFGIKPVFVFDGIAPPLKRETISRRRARREGHRESTKRTAEKLLTLQLQKLAKGEMGTKGSSKLKGHKNDKRKRDDTEDKDEEDYVYYDERNVSEGDRYNSKKQKQQQGGQNPFKQQDQYHLPEMEQIGKIVDVNDPRLMTEEELQQYADEFQDHLNSGLYDTMEVDFESPEFQSLPLATQYQLVNTARLRSRLRMGYTAEQLDKRFQDRMEFSKFQINRVSQRNYLTQKIMNIVGMDDPGSAQRIAGQKGGEYILDRNETGWTLALQSDKQQRHVVIDSEDDEDKRPGDSNFKNEGDDEDEEDDIEWEDVPLDSGKSIDAKNKDKVELEKAGDAASQFPPELDVFETRVERQQLYERLQEQAALEDQFSRQPVRSSDHKELESKPETKRTGGFKSSRPGYMPFLLKGDLDLGVFKPKESEGSSSNKGLASTSGTLGQSQDEVAGRREGAGGASMFGESSLFGKLKSKDVGNEKGNVAGFQAGVHNSSISEAKNEADENKTDKGLPLDDPVSSDETSPVQPLPPWFSKEDNKQEREIRHGLVVANEQEQEARLGERNKQQVVDRDRIREMRDEQGDASGDEDAQLVDKAEAEADTADTNETVDTVYTNETDQKGQFVDDSDTRKKEKVDSNKSTLLQHQQEVVPKLRTDHLDSARSPDTEEYKAKHSDTNSGAHLESETSGAAKTVQDSALVDDPDLKQHEQQEQQQQQQQQQQQSPELAKLEAEYDEEETEKLVEQMMGEIEENERFTKSLNSGKPNLNNNYAAEIDRLKKQVHTDQRDADQVSSTMVEECQTLLNLFGIPYITAPMEAEAQCAALVDLNLVDGVVTDDSDCFLFGGNKIYKNMFNQAKWVERYDSEDVEREFGLDRGKLIQLAQILGSDYTDGLTGVGPVQGLELLAEFGNLEQFRDWWTKEQQQTKPSPKMSEFCRKFRQRHLTKLFLPERFPDSTVRDAYLNPEVDQDATQFEWGKPDLDQLRRFLSSSTGWTQERIDEMLVPVIRDMNKPAASSTVQSTLMDYMGVSPLKRMEIGHKRMHKAVEKLRQQDRR